MSEHLNGERGDAEASDLPKVVSIVSAYVSNNSLRAADLPGLIGSVHTAIRQLGDSPVAVPETPAVPIKKSLTKDYIICLEDGKKLKMLKRYLRTNYNTTPEEYRAKWNLPRDYPMVAQAYAATRKELAQKIGLGRKKVVETVEAVEQAVAKPVKKAAKSVVDGIAAAREHLGTTEAKPARKPRAKKEEQVTA